ncbi:MAG: O-antigen ligase family protein [Balneolales bacterium]|nr:O-antigen ligase family protein [Balneolales bacterium]
MILPATMIRGAWIATFIGTIVVIYYRYRNESSILNILSKRWIKFSVVPLILILLTIFSIALYQLKPDSVNGRLLIWKVTSDMITDHPLTGVGVGQFQSTV